LVPSTEYNHAYCIRYESSEEISGELHPMGIESELNSKSDLLIPLIEGRLKLLTENRFKIFQQMFKEFRQAYPHPMRGDWRTLKRTSEPIEKYLREHQATY